MEKNYGSLNNKPNPQEDDVLVFNEKVDLGVDLDTGELDDNGNRIVIKRDNTNISPNFKIDDNLKKEIMNAERKATFVGEAFTTPEEREYLKRKSEEENKKNEIDEKIKAERRRKGLCEYCGGDPCRTDCLYR